MDHQAHIIVVDDHQDIRELVVRYLTLHGFRVSAVEHAAAFLTLMTCEVPDLVILDIMMPGDDGLTLGRQIRATSRLPIIFLTAMAEESDRITGLDLGGDDYLTKPFSPRELLSRIRAVLRRTQDSLQPSRTSHAERIQFNGLILDLRRREVVGDDGIAIPLSTVEFRLLRALLDHPGEVLRREQLLELAGARSDQVWDRSVDTQISRLRRKIERDPKNPILIRTEWGGGYCFTGSVMGAR